MGAAKKLIAADLFCGGGGFSKGFALACEDLNIKNVRLIAVNHSQVAVETHRANHPWAEHHCSRVDQLDPRKLVPEGRMKILIAAPECTNHANARGGRPINDQSRATAWDVVKWAQELYIETILIENVREIMTWGPLGADGRPLKSKKGEIFDAWMEAIRRCGYRLEHRILNAADFGGATTRKRFFLIAKRGNHRIAWPKQTHAKDADNTGDLFRDLKPWRPAREIIDWKKKGVSIFNRKKPLAPNTLKRIEAGILKFWGPVAEPFLVLLRGTQVGQIDASVHSIQEPLPTVTANGTHVGLVEPFAPDGAFILQQQSGGTPRSVNEPLPTIATKGAQALVQAFILAPLGIGRGNAPRSVDQPMPTILASRGGGHLVQSFIVQVNHGGAPNGRVHPVEEPLRTVTGENGHALVESFIVPFFGEGKGQAPRTHGIDAPLPSPTGHGAGALVEPFIAKYYGTANCVSIREPIPTVTGKDRFAVVSPKLDEQPQGIAIDILFRMLEPDELARAMGFEGYEFRGTKKQKILMIGNAVEVNMAKALVKAILEN